LAVLAFVTEAYRKGVANEFNAAVRWFRRLFEFARLVGGYSV
jgi:hypothetical protein